MALLRQYLSNIIEGGCGDDGVRDFRAGLIGLGRDVYYAAVADPNTLVRQPTRGVDFSHEGMLYAATRADGAAVNETGELFTTVVYTYS